MANYNSNISHQIIQYVDDSTSIISTNNNSELQKCFNHYFEEIKGYYDIDKLLINAYKSKLLIIYKPGHRNSTVQIKLQANGYIIKQLSKIKVIGIYITSGLTNNGIINNIISKINYHINVL